MTKAVDPDPHLFSFLDPDPGGGVALQNNNMKKMQENLYRYGGTYLIISIL